MRRSTIAAVSTASAALLLAGCTTAGEPTPSQKADAWALAQARPTGPAENCVMTNRIRDTEVRDDRTIDFEMIDGRIYRNRLPYACPSLAFQERFAYRTSTGQLCSVDVIRVLHSDNSPGASCGLGKFQPVEIPPR